jgi:hypothetical protein
MPDHFRAPLPKAHGLSAVVHLPAAGFRLHGEVVRYGVGALYHSQRSGAPDYHRPVVRYAWKRIRVGSTAVVYGLAGPA